MSMTSPLLWLHCVVAIAAAVGAAAQERDGRLGRDLEVLSRRTVYFGHQSVGTNILEGVRELAAKENVTLRIEERSSAAGMAPGTVGHGLIAENSDPMRKLRSFAAALSPGASLDLALMKFCYVDVGAETDVAALFAAYRTTLRGLRARHPRTAFVHATVPLTTVQGGVKAMVKWLLGQPPYGFLENAKREEFNALLRQAYLGREPLFDLARVESTSPDGLAETVFWNGRSVSALVGAYTDDGGHLNREGRARVARALVATLAAAVPASASAVLGGRSVRAALRVESAVATSPGTPSSGHGAGGDDGPGHRLERVSWPVPRRGGFRTLLPHYDDGPVRVSSVDRAILLRHSPVGRGSSAIGRTARHCSGPARRLHAARRRPGLGGDVGPSAYDARTQCCPSSSSWRASPSSWRRATAWCSGLVTRWGATPLVSVSNKVVALALTLPALAFGAGIAGVILAQAVAGAQLCGCGRSLSKARPGGSLLAGDRARTPRRRHTIPVHDRRDRSAALPGRSSPLQDGSGQRRRMVRSRPERPWVRSWPPRPSWPQRRIRPSPGASSDPAAFRREVRSTLRPLLWLGALGATGTYLFASTAIGLIYGSRGFGPASTILEVFSPFLFLLFIDILLGNIIYASGRRLPSRSRRS